jgi:hypothetical protein
MNRQLVALPRRKIERSPFMEHARLVFCSLAGILCAACLHAQAGDPNASPPVTKADMAIVKRASQILDSPAKWNRADNRVCPTGAKTFSLYCALERATEEISKNFERRGAAMEEARSVVAEIAPNVHRYGHWLMDYNNDPNTTFMDIQGVFWLLEKRVAMRLVNHSPAIPPIGVTKEDVRVARRVRELLDSPEKWDRAPTDCLPNATAFSLLCVFAKAEKEVTGNSADGAAIREARAMISELDPTSNKYKSRLADYNSDPSVTFQDLQEFLSRLEDRVAAGLAAGDSQRQ